MELHVFPILIPPPTSLSTQFLWVFPVHQARALVSCIQPGLVICFTIDNIHVSMLFSRNIAPSPSPTESKSLPWNILHTFNYLFIFIFKLIYFDWRLITLQYFGGSCHTLHESAMGVHVSRILNPSHLPPHPIPLGCPSAPALSSLFHISNLDWSYTSHMVIYMFQCYSLRSSHPLFLPHRPKVCSLYLCLFCCFAYRIIVTIFLNSLYMH